MVILLDMRHCPKCNSSDAFAIYADEGEVTVSVVAGQSLLKSLWKRTVLDMNGKKRMEWV